MFIFNWSNPGGEILKILYGMFVQLDVWIYSLAGACFDLIKNIYEFDFFSGGNLIGQVKNRIYMALGIVMVFRVILAGVQFIVNPDLFDDKEKGLVGILKNALITVILIAAVPAVFRLALNVQGSIVKAIPSIIFGSGKTEVSYTVIKRDPNNSQLESEQLQTTVSQNNITTGNDIAFSVLQGFISPAKYTKNDKIPNGKKVGDQKDDKASVGINDSQNSYQIHDIETFRQYATTNMEEGLENASYSYMIFISTLGGVFLVYILASMSFDVAIRTIKLGIIQMLSPIPIASYMFKKDNFNKFVKMSFKVYADLFIRMVVIYVIILVVQILVNSGILNLGRSTDNIFDFLRNIILIFGLLMFAKSAPKFLTELLGLPDVTSGEMAAMFKRAGAMAGATGSILSAGTSNFAANKGKSFGTKLKSAIAGATSAGFRGTRAALNGKGMKETFKIGQEGAKKARQNRELDRMNMPKNYKHQWQNSLAFMATRAKTATEDFMGIDTEESLAEAKQKAYSATHQDVGNFKKAVMGRIIKSADVSIRDTVDANGAASQLGKLLNENSDVIRRSGNKDLIKYLNKFEMKTDSRGRTAWALKAGESFSYHDIAAINADAVNAGIGSIAGLTGENGAVTLLAQKELFSDAMTGKVKHTDGTLYDEFNVGSGKTHVDIATAFATANQHLAENAVPLNGGNALELQEEFKRNFAGMDDRFQGESARIAGEMSRSPAARAREANARHKQNNQQNGGK